MLRRDLHVIALASLLLATSLAGCGGEEPARADSDGDELSDAEELAGREITVVTASGSEPRRVMSDPVKSDTDGDTLNDGDEEEQGTDPRSPDTDGDRLLDGFNATLSAGDPRVAEWRAAAILESPTLTFLGELGQCRHVGGLKGAQYSSDRPFADGIGDGEELLGWDISVRGQARHVTSDPCSPDGDSDLARDEQELQMGSDPRARDTDADGAIDGADLDPLWDVRIAFLNVSVSGTNGSVEVSASFEDVTVAPGQRASFEFDVPEEVIAGNLSRDAFEHKAILYASDAISGQPLDLFGGAYEVLLSFRPVNGTATADDRPVGHELSFTGADGTLTLRWDVVRR